MSSQSFLENCQINIAIGDIQKDCKGNELTQIIHKRLFPQKTLTPA